MINNQPQRKALTGMLIQANKKRRNHDFQGAIAIYLEILEWFGKSAKVLAVIANCYYAQDTYNPESSGINYSKAIEWIKKAIEIEPNNADLHASLAEYYWLGTLQYEQAAQEYRRAIALNPCVVNVLTSAASLYGVPGNVVTLEEAIKWLNQASLLESTEPRHLVQLVEIYINAGMVDKAHKVFDRVLLCVKPLTDSDIRRIAEMMDI